MTLSMTFKVERVRYSVTQGEANVYVNDQLIAKYGDTIVINGQYGPNTAGWASSISDESFIKVAMQQYTEAIMQAAKQL
jgi:hypothetical protein